ncbi:unnamed protein product (macronuclear) [Paramecium tetraurelia]|uniref:Uncharacterized protein n=1 Tax=Paramecium tetraurelia TaxID=5888 RepID=A0E2Y8_PARTE|nr:uncharacterized protein GSPATT00022827001 [Paramecium tetraurelia]CAK89655.1 unnamed protein product [Paramecium tetraurelia]|eukprot:XP_001457052.1 hypothetical protein (macronuclear) [Paramecium tetraurelia strain d4-2]
MQFLNPKKQKFQQIQKQEFNFQLLDENRVFMTGTFTAFTDEVKQYIKQNNGSFQNLDGEKGWIIPIGNYQNLITNLKSLQSEVMIKQLPQLLQKLQNLNMKEIKYFDNGQLVTLKYNNQISYEQIDKTLEDTLYEYQKDCVKQGLKFNGRILIADDMGVGKTVQSLALASMYKQNWPLLIMCPSPLRLNWQDEIIHWLKIHKTDIQLINCGREGIRMNAKIVVVSYDICAKIKDNLMNRKFQICIADECHYLKSPSSIRSQVCVPILRQCMQTILLTGTPALSKPKDLFNLLNIIRPDIFGNFKEFGYRYCDPKLSRFTKGIDFDGASNLKELYFLLRNYIMIRRQKKDVLSQLPEKRRVKVRIPGETSQVKQIGALLNQLGNIDIQQLINKDTIFQEQKDQSEQLLTINSILQKCYMLTGQAKIKAIKDYICTLFENEIKFLFFAHHQDVLDAVQEYCVQNEIQYMRIDGNVGVEQRHLNVQMFQNNDEIRIAILSVTSANYGITLTAASTIVFGEMHWTPAIMLQAEDRAHRIGQVQCVDCHYLIGDGTLDDHIFNKIENKMNTVSNFIDGQKQNLGALEFSAEEALVKGTSKPTLVSDKGESILQDGNIQPSNQALTEDDMQEIYQLLESRSKEKQDQLDLEQAESQQKKNNIKKKQVEISSQVKNQCSTLKQQLLDKYLSSNNAKKEVIEDKKEFNKIQKVIEENKQLTYGKIPQKLSYQYLQSRLNADSKSTESGQKKLALHFTKQQPSPNSQEEIIDQKVN